MRLVHPLFDVMTASAYVVSIGVLTDDAKDFAAGRNIEAVDAKPVEASDGSDDTAVLTSPQANLRISPASNSSRRWPRY